MNQISYDQWQAMIRLPYLAVLACWLGQRARLYRGQVNCMMEHLAAIRQRDVDSLLGQLADDAAREVLNHLKDFKKDDLSHFALQCARVLTAARSAMTAQQFQRYLSDMSDMVEAMNRAVPWYGRLRSLFEKSLPKDPRATLKRALADAAAQQEALSVDQPVGMVSEGAS